MAKQYRIDLMVNATQAEGAARKASGSMNGVAAAAKKAADAAAREAKRLADIQAREAKRAAEIAAREAKKAADAQAREAKRAADLAAREAKKLSDTQAREAKKAADAQAREAKKAADTFAREAKKAADSTARENKRATDAAAREAKRLADIQAREAKRAAEVAAREAKRVAQAARTEMDRAKQTADVLVSHRARTEAMQVASLGRVAAKQAAADAAARLSAAKTATDQAKAALDAATAQAAAADRSGDAQLQAQARVALADARVKAKQTLGAEKLASRQAQLARHAADDAEASAKRQMDAAWRTYHAHQEGATGASSSVDALAGKVAMLAAGYLGMRAAVGVFKAIETAANEASEAAQRSAEATLKARDDLREGTANKGKGSVDNEELAKFSALRMGSGLRHDEAVTFSNEVLNAVGTVSETKFSMAEREKLVTQGAKLAARLGGGTEGAKARASVQGTLPNFLQGKGGQPLRAEDVVATADAAEVILARGKGTQTQSAQQYQKVLTTLTSEGMAGSFKNPLKAASLTALASKFGEEDAATHIQQAVREVEGITRFRKGEGRVASQAATLQAAGIDEFMDPEQKMRKLFEHIDRETGGGKKEAPKAYLARHGFQGREGTESLARFYESYQQGQFQELMAMADKPIDVAAPQRKFAEFAAGPGGQKRLADARLDAARIAAGQKEEQLHIARARGEAVEVEKGLDQSTLYNSYSAILGVAVGSQTRGREILREQMGLQDRAKELGVGKLPGKGTNTVDFIPGLGPLVAPAVNSATGVHQSQANYLEAEARAQRIMQQAAQPNVPIPLAPPAAPVAPGVKAAALAPMGGMGIRSMIGAAAVGAMPGQPITVANGAPISVPQATGGGGVGDASRESIAILREMNAHMKAIAEKKQDGKGALRSSPAPMPAPRAPLPGGAARP